MEKTLQSLIAGLKEYWSQYGCTIIEGYDLEVGAGTFHPETFFGCLRPLSPVECTNGGIDCIKKNCRLCHAWKSRHNVAYVQASRRPADGRYGKHPGRLQRYYQFQVLLRPSPPYLGELDGQACYLRSLQHLGLVLEEHEIRFIHDDWKSPSLGAWGCGWEVWLDGMEVTQYTYFQEVGGQKLSPPALEITYGLERLAMYLQDKATVYLLNYSPHCLYESLFLKQEEMFSRYNYEEVDIEFCKTSLQGCLNQSDNCMKKDLIYPAYDWTLKASHYFNLLDAKQCFSVQERASRLQDLKKSSVKIANKFVQNVQILKMD